MSIGKVSIKGANTVVTKGIDSCPFVGVNMIFKLEKELDEIKYWSRK
jgi:hypothetical protein